MAWLSNWTRRIKLTIDGSKIDENLTDFPVMVSLGSSSAFFDEIGTSSHKVAFTTSDAVTQCYAEIEHFDFDAKKAHYWIKAPTLSSGTNQVFYLYYDSTQLDNDDYIGDVGDVVAQSVWDSNFVGVWHLGESTVFTNSSSNLNNGVASGKIGTTNIALSKTCSQSSTFVAEVASHAVDNNTGTRAVTGNVGVGDWWRIDLGAVYGIGKIQIVKNLGDRPRYYYIQTANDYNFTVNLVNIVTGNETATTVTWDTSNFGINVSTRYIRLITRTSSQYIDTREFRVYAYVLDTFTGVDGKIGKAIDFGGNGYISVGTNASLDTTTALTYEAIFKTSTVASQFLITKYNNGVDYQAELHINNTGSLAANVYDGELSASNANTDSGLGGNYIDDEYHYVATRIDVGGGSDSAELFVDGILNIKGATSISDINSLASVPTQIGERYNTTSALVMDILDEIRISNIARSPEWIKATYYSNWGTLITYGSEQLKPGFYYSGYITELSSPVSREVRIYNRITGELVSSTTSSGIDGYYYLTTVTSGEHYIVVLDDDTGETYNALINDKLLPRGTV
jgi:hypothetical protein